MLKKLELIDDEVHFKKPFVEGYYNDGREISFDFLDDEMLKKVMVGHGYFVFVFNEEFYSISHSWVEGGLFGSFTVCHHILGEPGVPVAQINIHEYYPHFADLLTGKINAFQIIADSIIEEFSEGDNPMAKHMKDLNFLRGYFETHDGLDPSLRSVFERMGVANNEFR